MKKTLFWAIFALALSATWMTGCLTKTETETKTVTNTDTVSTTDTVTLVVDAALKQQFVTNYSKVVYASYVESRDKAVELKTAIDAFVAAPDSAKFEAARTAWKAARVPYGQTEAYRFSQGPIDVDDDAPEGQLNAWPLDESFIDYVDGDANAGIVNGSDAITKAHLASVNGDNDNEANVSTGYHAIEFLLWGQDTSAPAAEIPGQRPYADYLTSGGTASNQDRRGTYLKVVTELLVDDLNSLVDAWAPSAENYRKTFESQSADVNLANILAALVEMGGAELARERMDVALILNDQEDEHSCFSDNTHIDVIENARGIQNVFLGRFGSVDGTGIYDLIKSVNATLADDLKASLENSVTLAEAIPAPFDKAISADDAGNDAVGETIAALRKQSQDLAAAAEVLGINLVNAGE